MSTAQERDVQNKDYLYKDVNPIVEPLMLEVVKQKPENQVSLLGC